ncbi:MAG: tyrosine recombinase XerC [Ruminococcaceae bacterium]|nr:tyrosine recombinase XerC [Oscillospiraceae bacterium]
MRQEELITLPALVRTYLNYLSAIKSKSMLTVLEYGSDLRLFYRFIAKSRGICDNNVPFDEINIAMLSNDIVCSVTLDEAYAFLVYCRNERKNDNNARARKAVAIKRFFRYLEVNGYISVNRIAFLESPQTKKSLPKYLTLEQSVTLLQNVDGKFKERDYCILTLFLNCGLRLSELVGINISHLKDDNTLVVLGKGNKERTIYLNNACINAISAYMAVRPVDGVIDRDALFISNQKKRISKQSVQKMVEANLKKCGFDGMGLSTHKLRHTAATLMYQHGNVDPLQLKEILGHENLSTTEIYTHIRDEQLKQAVDSNPLNNPSNLKKSRK